MAIPVYIGKINGHGRHAEVPDNPGACLPEHSPALVDPELVHGVKKIVAHVNIGQLVTVDVAHHDAQPPVHGRLCDWFTAGIQGPTVRPANRLEPARAKVLI